MKESTKDFSYFLKVRTADGKIVNCNETNTARGYRQSWYKTPKAAAKGLKNAIAIAERCREEVLESYCFTRSGKRF